jgi:hypothetical protein
MKVFAGLLVAALIASAALLVLVSAQGPRNRPPEESTVSLVIPAPAAAGIPSVKQPTVKPATTVGFALDLTGRPGFDSPRANLVATAARSPSPTPRRPGPLTATPLPGTRVESPPSGDVTLPRKPSAATSIQAPAVTRKGVASQAEVGRRIYTGVSIAGAPWDTSALSAWEKNVAGKTVSIVHFWVFWRQNGRYQQLDPALLDTIRARGSIPMITWAPEEGGRGPAQPDFQLAAIIAGKHDAYIKQWAARAQAWGKPFFLRWGHEPDGDWFPWGEDANGNRRGEYAVAWRHVHDLFAQAGATNVTWVWCPNVEFPNSPRSSYASLYPGDSYVDWICVDGYNWGPDFPENGGWSSFHQIFRYAYDTMVLVAPNKPMMLGEWGSSDNGGSKADWIRDAFGAQIPARFPKIAAVVWYNQRAGPVDWRIESSPASFAAYRAVMASPVYRSAEYGALAGAPIPRP